ncbi:MAG: LPS assembly lipoprotein LptE [Sandaracinobacteroides sp.]
MRLAFVLALLLLAGCNLQPVYSGGSRGAAQGLLSQVEIAPIPEKTGFLVRDRLLERLNPGGNAAYRLEVVLDDDIIGFGIRGDNSIIRERRTLRARYRLTEIASGRVLLDTTAVADAGIDVVSSEFAVVAAESTAVERLARDIADQIVARLALLGRTPAAPAPLPAPPAVRPPLPAPSAAPALLPAPAAATGTP